MLAISDILDAVAGLIASQYPGEEIYTNQTPANFARPSFLLTGGPVKAEVDGALTELRVGVTVTCFVAVDEYHNSHTEELLARMARVMGLLGDGCIAVGDRHPHIVALEGDYQFDFAEVKATLHYREERPKGVGYPMMGDVRIKLKEDKQHGTTEYSHRV